MKLHEAHSSKVKTDLLLIFHITVDYLSDLLLWYRYCDIQCCFTVVIFINALKNISKYGDVTWRPQRQADIRSHLQNKSPKTPEMKHPDCGSAGLMLCPSLKLPEVVRRPVAVSQRAAVSQSSAVDLQVKRREDIKVETRLNII